MLSFVLLSYDLIIYHLLNKKTVQKVDHLCEGTQAFHRTFTTLELIGIE